MYTYGLMLVHTISQMAHATLAIVSLEYRFKELVGMALNLAVGLGCRANLAPDMIGAAI